MNKNAFESKLVFSKAKKCPLKVHFQKASKKAQNLPPFKGHFFAFESTILRQFCIFNDLDEGLLCSFKGEKSALWKVASKNALSKSRKARKVPFERRQVNIFVQSVYLGMFVKRLFSNFHQTPPDSKKKKKETFL